MTDNSRIQRAVQHMADHAPIAIMYPSRVQGRLRAIAGERHRHVRSLQGDLCDWCLHDLRDGVHLRVGEPS